MQAFPRFRVTLCDKKQTDNISRSGSYNSSKVLSKVCRPCLSHGARPCWSTERASLRVKLRGSLELAGRLRAPAPPPPPCDNNPPREGGPASMGIDFASLSGPRHMHPPWNTGGRMSEDDLVRFFRSNLGDTSRDGGACISPHPKPPRPHPRVAKGPRVSGPRSAEKTFVAKVAFLRRDIVGNARRASKNRTLRFPVSESGKPVRPLRSTAPVRGPSRVDRRSLDVSPTGFGVRQSAVRGRESRSAF